MLFIIILILLTVWGMVALEERKQNFKDELLLMEQQAEARREAERVSAELEEYWRGLERMRVELEQHKAQNNLQSRLEQLIACQGCVYFHGKHGIHCSVHPSGGEIECKDWESKA